MLRDVISRTSLPLAASGMLQDASAAGGGEGPSMLSVLCHQRDRFRARVRELEDNLVAVQQELGRVGGARGVCWECLWGLAWKARCEREWWLRSVWVL